MAVKKEAITYSQLATEISRGVFRPIYLLMGEKDGEASDYFFPYGAVPHQIYDDEYYYSVTTELITELI